MQTEDKEQDKALDDDVKSTPGSESPTVSGDDWRKSLVGEDPERLKHIERFKTPEELIGALQKADSGRDEDWRARVAGDDEKLQKLTKRYSTPTDMARALQAAQAKISEGVVVVPTEKSSEAERASFRKAVGVPEEPDKYEMKLPDGAPPLTDVDKEAFKIFAKMAHTADYTQKQMNVAVEALQEFQKIGREEMERQAMVKREATENELVAEWGPREYRARVNLINRMFDGHADVRDFMRAPMADGTALGAHKPFVKFMDDVARKLSSEGALIDGEPAENVDVGARKRELMDLMHKDPKRYASKSVQDELMMLTRATQRLRARK